MRVKQVIETCLYCSDLEAAESFYTTVLGLEVIMREEGRHVFFRCGEAVFLVFNPSESSKCDDDVPGHGSNGTTHVAFAIEKAELPHWRDHVKKHGVEIEREINWPNGARSLYFRDPANNSVEIVTPDLWASIEN